MILTGIRLTNWECFRGTHEVSLGSGTYAVVAAMEGDPDRSNALGKSGLLRALRFVLDGKKPRTVAALDQLISRGEQELGVDLEFSDGTFISRTKKRGASVQTHLIAGSDVGELDLYQERAEQQLWQLIGFEPDDLLSTCIAEQRQLASLVLPPPGRVKSGSGFEEAVHGWLGLDGLVRAGEQALSDLRSKSQALRALEQEQQQVEGRLASFDPQAAREAIEWVDVALAANRKVEELRASRQAERDEWLRTKARREQAEQEVEAAEDLARMFEQRWPTKPLVTMSAKRAHEAAQTELVTARNAAQEKQKLVTRGFDGRCPVNGCDCPIREQINEQAGDNKLQLFAANTALEQANIKAATARQLFTQQEHRLRSWELDKSDLERLQERAAQAKQLLALPLPPEPVLPSVPDISEQVQSAAELRVQLAEHERLLARQQELTSLVDAARFDAEKLRAASLILGPEGAQRRVSERAVRLVERAANAELEQAGIDLRLEVRFGRETQQPAVHCDRCGAAFPVSRSARTCLSCQAPRGMKVVPELRFALSRVSGGMEDLGGLALRVAAFRWLRAKRHASWSVAWLDEPFAHLDRAHVRALSAHVQSLLASTFQQSFVCAHHASVLEAMPRRLLVTGRGDWSALSAA